MFEPPALALSYNKTTDKEKGAPRNPSPLIHDGEMYIVYTTGWEGRTFAIARSSNFVDWDLQELVLINTPGMTSTNTSFT